MLMNTYLKPQIVFEKGDGCYVISKSGEKYLDFSSGIGVNCLGYSHPAILEAMVEGSSLMHLSNLYDTEQDRILADKLVKRTGLDSVFFANSGAEANEGAIKLARKYSFDHYGSGRDEIITLKNSFHGRTITTLSATGQDKFHKFYMPFTAGFSYAEPNHLADLLSLVTEKTCAILIELVQGEGGVFPLEKDYVTQLFNLCQERDILFIVDEVQTGIGRCGQFFVSEEYNVLPDIVTFAKGLGGGMPIGAIVAGKKCKDTFGLSDHGSTFGGNPLACRISNAVVDKLNRDFLISVRENGNYLKKSIARLNNKYIKEVRGLGLMLGMELTGVSASDVRNMCLEKQLLILTAGNNTIRLLPPLIVNKSQIDQCINILNEVLLSI